MAQKKKGSKKDTSCLTQKCYEVDNKKNTLHMSKLPEMAPSDRSFNCKNLVTMAAHSALIFSQSLVL